MLTDEEIHGCYIVVIAFTVIFGMIIYTCGYTAGKNSKKTLETKVIETVSETESETEPVIYVKVTEPALIDMGEFKITAYCTCAKCCGKSDGITASGTKATAGRTVAVDPTVIPYGTKIIINGHTYVAEDTGGAINGNRIDICVGSHEEALNFGVQYANVYKAP